MKIYHLVLQLCAFLSITSNSWQCLFIWTFSTTTDVADIVQAVAWSVRLVAGSLYSLNFRVFSLLFSVVSRNPGKIAEHCCRAPWDGAFLSLIPKSLVFSLTCVFFLSMKELGLRNPAKGERRKEWMRVDIGGLLFLVRGINGVKPLVDSPQTKRFYPHYTTRILSP